MKNTIYSNGEKKVLGKIADFLSRIALEQDAIDGQEATKEIYRFSLQDAKDFIDKDLASRYNSGPETDIASLFTGRRK